MRGRTWLVAGCVSGLVPLLCGGTAWAVAPVSGADAVPVAGGAGAAPVPVASAPRADLTLHGSAVLAEGRAEVRLTPRNNGPAAVPDAGVLLRWSAPLAERQKLPGGCAPTDGRTVLCRTGALPADGTGEPLRVRVRFAGRPSEVTLELDTAWTGGVLDTDRSNDRLSVLVLETGDEYAF
ncbi:hypothetical protein KUM39_11520 [Streptomyces sp. J2-1]|uniref:hypothetical protein n=1 Tax=Streptomyces corallincola TaxID=2851888 RepID=UPI001C3801DC|nr:hypothetical protein [Streptomyces corallincola]MBV2354986.1 hypothetical protein [Streptomyces corallincola]